MPSAYSLLSSGGSAEALSVCAEFERLSAWKAIADEVELPAQGLDLIIHLGNEVIKSAPCVVTRLRKHAATTQGEVKQRVLPYSEGSGCSHQRFTGDSRLLDLPSIATLGLRRKVRQKSFST